MPAVRAAFNGVFRPEDDDTPAAARSRRDWIVDSALFLFAAVLAITTGVNSFQHGLHGPLLAVDAIGGAVLCLALWWRRRWALGSLRCPSSPCRLRPERPASSSFTPSPPTAAGRRRSSSPWLRSRCCQ